MPPPRIGTRRPWFRWGVRTLLATVFGCALVFGWVRWQFDGYQRDWRIEQAAIAEMEKAGGNFSIATEEVGPSWLRALAGPGRAKYFHRVTSLVFVASDPEVAGKHRASLKHLESIVGL